MQNISSSLGGIGGLGGVGGLGGMGGMSGFGNNNSTGANSNSFGNMFGNPMFPMLGSGFGANQNGFNFPSNQQNPFSFSNPILSNGEINQQPPNSSSAPQNNMFSFFQNLQNSQQKAADEIKFSGQIKELNSMGFADKEKCIKFLK